MSQVALLYRLQQFDDEIRAGKKRLSDVVRLQAESNELLAARNRSETTAVELHQLHAHQTDINLELNSLVEKSNRSEQRLYSGMVKNPKELADLQSEVDSLGRRRGVLEDELLEAMILVEEAEEEHAKASEALQQIEGKWQKNQQDLKNEQAELIERINNLTVQRKQTLSLIHPGSLAAYEETIRRVGTTAVVALTNNRCRGCLVTVPASLVKAADEGKLVRCDSCDRILCPL